jgi:ribonuclease-3
MASTSCQPLIELLRAPDPDLNRIITTFVTCFNAAYGDPESRCWDVTKDEWERYEFLGDSVLKLVVAQALFTQQQVMLDEGAMTKKLNRIVSNRSLDLLIRQQGERTSHLIIPDVIREQKTYGERITGGAFEALTGALYCELGLDEVAYFINAIMRDSITGDIPDENAIGILQEHFQKRYKSIPTYRQAKREGPDHNPIFTYEVLFDNRVLGRGSGESVRQAQQEAARRALDALKKEP